MTKQQFTAELLKALASVDPNVQAEILTDIHEHFAEGENHGLSEEEICRKLGQPGQIAEQVIEELSASKNQSSYGSNSGSRHNNWQGKDSFADSLGNLMENVGDFVGNIGDIVEQSVNESMFGQDGAHKPFVINLNNMDENIPNFIDLRDINEATKIRGGHEINMSGNYTDVKSLDINLKICNLQILPAPQGDKARVVIQGRSRYNKFSIDNKNGCLSIVEEHPIVKFEIFNFKSNLNATVYVPSGFDGNIKVKTSAGHIKVSNIRGSLDLNTAAGSIQVDNHKGYSAKLRSSAGGIKLTGCEIADINAKSSAGSINIDGDEAGNLTLDSSAGGVKLRFNKLYGETNILSSAGATRLEAREVQGNITAKSSAGSIKMRLPIDVNCRIELKKPSIGSVHNYLTGNPSSPYVLRASASVGSVTLEPLE